MPTSMLTLLFFIRNLIKDNHIIQVPQIPLKCYYLHIILYRKNLSVAEYLEQDRLIRVCNKKVNMYVYKCTLIF